MLWTGEAVFAGVALAVLAFVTLLWTSTHEERASWSQPFAWTFLTALAAFALALAVREIAR